MGYGNEGWGKFQPCFVSGKLKWTEIGKGKLTQRSKLNRRGGFGSGNDESVTSISSREGEMQYPHRIARRAARLTLHLSVADSHGATACLLYQVPLIEANIIQIK